mmetsp:Transcript_32694/g.53013  ORF Transcript_32694/g.53013 Transcript_32694/m.53013 type:complete len:515 (+) Transcript_32694:79-1623(+)
MRVHFRRLTKRTWFLIILGTWVAYSVVLLSERKLRSGRYHSPPRTVLPAPGRHFTNPVSEPEIATEVGILAPKTPYPVAKPADLAKVGILLLAYNRPPFLKRTLYSLLKLSGIGKYELHVSQDGFHEGVAAVAKEYGDQIFHRQKPRLDSSMPGHVHIAVHYKDALDYLFFERHLSRVILVEDDMIFSPDFLSFFEQTAPLLDQDPSIWCISSWNDNGFKSMVDDNKRLFRTSYFPGLGWMLKKSLWEELSPHFPRKHWDHWMRISTTNKGRDCVVPEISRNFNIGDEGEHMKKDEYTKFLANIAYNEVPGVDLGDLSYLILQNYETLLHKLVEQSQITLSLDDLKNAIGSAAKGRPLFLGYKREHFQSIADHFGIWPFTRASHKHTTLIKSGGHQIILADLRQSPYVPDNLEILAPPNLQTISGSQGQSCSLVCDEKQLQCSAGDFDRINDCALLVQKFPCEAGCSLEWGPDIPNYLSQVGDLHYGRCLVTEWVPTCEASHPFTRRLCPCIPR